MNLPPPSVAPSTSPSARQWSPPSATPPTAPAPPPAPATVRALLFDTAEPSLDIATKGPEGEALDRLPPPLRTAARKEAKRAVLGALDIALPDLVIRGWLRHKALKAAAERTRAGGRELVALADHTIASVHRPRITVTLDGTPLTVLAVTVELKLRVIGLTAVVEKAALVGLESGALEATATLKVGADVVATRAQRLDAHHAIPIDRPRPLLGDAAGPDQPGAGSMPPRPPSGSA